MTLRAGKHYSTSECARTTRKIGKVRLTRSRSASAHTTVRTKCQYLLRTPITGHALNALKLGAALMDKGNTRRAKIQLKIAPLKGACSLMVMLSARSPLRNVPKHSGWVNDVRDAQTPRLDGRWFRCGHTKSCG